MKILCRKTLSGHLCPIDDAGKEAVGRLPVDDLVQVEFRRPRNLGHHRKFFALINLIYMNQTRYKSPDDLLNAIKVYIGHSVPARLTNGTEVRIPKSISFSAMDQTEFDIFWNRVVTCVCEQIIPNLSREDLERELLELCA